MRDIWSYENEAPGEEGNAGENGEAGKDKAAGENRSGIIRLELPVSSVIDGEEKVKAVFSDDGILTVTALSDMKRDLEIRIPEWAAADFPDAVNGYLPCGRLRSGQSVTLNLPMDLRSIEVKSDRRYCSCARGPYLLAAVSGQKDLLDFNAEKLRLRPLYTIDKEKYHIYFKNKLL